MGVSSDKCMFVIQFIFTDNSHNIEISGDSIKKQFNDFIDGNYITDQIAKYATKKTEKTERL